MKSCLNRKNFIVVGVFLAMLGLVGIAEAADPNLVSWWKFDEGSGTIAYDSAGGNDGTLYYGPQWTASRAGSALDFDGGNDHVRVPDNNSLDFGTGSFSISAWIKIEGSSSGPEHTIVGKRKPTGDNNAYHFCIVKSTGKLSLRTRDATLSTITGVTAINDGNWYHVAAVRNSNGMTELYVNGVLDASALLAVRDVDVDNDGFLGIGRHSTLGAAYFNGLIDDVRIYDRVLSGVEIQEIYSDVAVMAFNPNPADGTTGVVPDVILSWWSGLHAVSHDVYFGTGFADVNDATTSSATYMGRQDVKSWDSINYDANGLEYATTYYWRIDEVNGFNTWKGDVWSFTTYVTSWWKFDEGSGTIAYDSAGGNDGTIYGAQWSVGKIDGALSFDGVDDYVDCGNDSSLAITDNLTIAAWVKRATAAGSSNEIIVSKYNGVQHSYKLFFLGNDRMRWWLSRHGGTSRREYKDSTLQITDTNWHFIAATFESGTLKIYIDGEDSTGSGAGTISSIFASTEPLFIGQEDSSNYFNGLIDEVRIYNKAFSAGEIQELYQSGLPDVVGLEITGPEEVVRKCEAQYTALAYYADGQTRDVTNWAIWWVEPHSLANIEAGLLYPKPINEPQDITIYVQFTKGEHIIETGMKVHVSLGNTLYVPQEYETIQEAIDAAECGDTVIVSDGTYKGLGNKNIVFHGKAITVRSENGPRNCVINCEGAGRGFMFPHGEEDGNSVVDGFSIFASDWQAIQCERGSSPTITNCVISGTESWSAIFYHGNGTITNCIISDNNSVGIQLHGSPTITNCTISGNTPAQVFDGGGIVCWGKGSPKITNCTINENNGPGIICARGINPTITNCTITGNRVENYGGGIHCEESSAIITNSTISDNSSVCNLYAGSGGIYCNDGNLTIKNCNIAGNSSEGESATGGGIFCYDSSATITNCTIAGNSSEGEWASGGGIYYLYGNLTINNCTIADNSSEGERASGGGIFCYGDSQTITNCVITGNAAGRGGGIYCYRDSPTITNCTITGNMANEYGGGILIESSKRATLVNCTFAGNSALNGNAVACDSYEQVHPSDLFIMNSILWDGGNEIWNNDNSTITITYSDVKSGWVGPGNIDENPYFVEPGYWDANGVWIEGDYHLLEGSPCIDTGDPNYVAGPNETDLDGNARVVDGDNDGNSVVDMGVYEYRPPTPAELIAELLEGVGGLELPRGIENGLEAKLNAALRALEDENENNDIAAINTLGAFINAVEVQRGKKIPEAEADALIAAAQEIVELLSDG
ncbi:MAG: LamG-like jellyroll fold domain-containing protein [Planctomycetota bacterium]|jgi:parallel beta-helix repeat protein